MCWLIKNLKLRKPTKRVEVNRVDAEVDEFDFSKSLWYSREMGEIVKVGGDFVLLN